MKEYKRETNTERLLQKGVLS